MSILDRLKGNRLKKDNKSKDFIIKIDKRLEEAGVDNLKSRMTCSREILKSTVMHYRSLQKAALGKGDVDELVTVWINDLKSAMNTAGITDIVIQETAILDFIDIVADIMEGKV